MRKIILGDVIDVKRGASLSGDYYATEGKLIRLTLGNFNYPGGGFKENTSKTDIFFTGPIKPEFILKKGDIITPLTEQVSGLLGETATIPETGRYIQSGDVGLVIPDESKIDNRFAFYLISSPIIKKQLGAAAQQTKIRHTSPDAIKACEVWIPEDIKVQHAIGKLLDDINTKITNNHEVCNILEQQAKLLYDYWFVQFDFPDENGRPYKTSGGKMVWNEELKREIPEGWEVTSLGNITTNITDGVHETVEDDVNGDYRLLSCQNIKNGELNIRENIRLISEPTFRKIRNRTKLSKGDVLVSSVGTIGEMLLLQEEPSNYEFQRSVAMLKPDCNIISPEWLYETMVAHKEILIRMSHGAVQKCIFIGDISDLKVNTPPKSLVDNYTRIVTSFFARCNDFQKENKELSSLRDFLLPMLMNGQVKVGKTGEENAGT